MFVQFITGKVRDADALRAALDSWQQDAGAGVTGWLGTTAGVTDDGEAFIAARFESAEVARRNSDRPEQDAWWRRTAEAFEGEPTFRNCDDVTTFLGGGSDDAGFVQVLEGHSDDYAKTREMMATGEAEMGQARPDIIGGISANHGDGTFTEVVYFTSEAEAREGEAREPTPEEREGFEEFQALMRDVRYLDLRDPWFASPAP